MVISLVLQLFPVVTKKFWADELATYAYSTAPIQWTEQLIHPADDRPPLFYLFVRFFTVLTQNEALLRLPGVLCSLGAVYILYRTLKPYSKKATWLLVFVFSFSVFRMEQSWQFRDYSILTLPLALSFYFLTRFVQELYEKNSYNMRYLYGLSAWLFFGCLINYIFAIFAISVISLLVIILLLYWHTKKEKFRWNILGAVIALQLPLLFTMTYYLLNQKVFIQFTNAWIPDVQPYAYLLLNAVFVGFSSNYYRLYKMDPNLLPGYSIITVCLIGFFLFCSYLLQKKQTITKPILKTLFYSGLYIYITGLIGTFLCELILGTNMFLVRTFFCSGAGLLLSFGIGLYIVLHHLVRNNYIWMSVYFISFLYICVFSLLYIDNFKPSYFNLKAAIAQLDGLQVIEERLQPEDQVIYLPSDLHILYPSYYWRNTPEKFTHMRLFMNLYADEIDKFPEQYKKTLDKNMRPFNNIPVNKHEGKIYLLNWDISGATYDRIETYCEEKTGAGFKIIYKQKERLYYVAVCE